MNIFRIERIVNLDEDFLDVNDWLEDHIGPSIRTSHQIGISGKNNEYVRLYDKYSALCGDGKRRPAYAVDMVGETIGPGWKTVVAMEFEGERLIHEDWFVHIQDPVVAVHFKLMTC
jgi:hypothetical protein